MMRTIYFYLHFVVSLIWISPLLLKVKKLQKKDPKAALSLANTVARNWSRRQIAVSGSHFVVNGLENIPEGQTVLFVSNHQSNFDTAIFLSFIPVDKGYIAKTELLKIPLLRTWMKVIQCVFMDRTDMKKSAKAILEGTALLKNEYSMVIFPEGTRSKDGELLEFKAGSFRLATKTGVPIVPVTIDGSRRIMEANRYKIKPAEVFVTVHPPVATESLSKEELSALPNQIREIIGAPLRV